MVYGYNTQGRPNLAAFLLSRKQALIARNLFGGINSGNYILNYPNPHFYIIPN